MGKVIEKETGKPIEGAVVFIEFFTAEGTIGGLVHYHADAVETLTGDDGEFLIPPHRINTFKFMHGWDNHPRVIIFKPGYGAYPHHRDTEPHLGYGTIPDGQYISIMLPKLNSIEDRRNNLGGLFVGGVPQEKQKILNGLETQERVEIGLKP